MSDLPLSRTLPHDGTDAEARPVFAEERRVLGVRVSAWPGIIAPAVIGLLALTAWELMVRVKEIPPYILPGPILIAHRLFLSPIRQLIQLILRAESHHASGLFGLQPRARLVKIS